MQDIPTEGEACVTSLSIDDDLGATFAAGFGDGSLRLFDKRLAPPNSVLETFASHRTWIQDVKLQNGVRSMISGRSVLFALPPSPCGSCDVRS